MPPFLRYQAGASRKKRFVALSRKSQVSGLRNMLALLNGEGAKKPFARHRLDADVPALSAQCDAAVRAVASGYSLSSLILSWKKR